MYHSSDVTKPMQQNMHKILCSFGY